MLSKKIILSVLLATALSYAAAGAVIAGEAGARHARTPSEFNKVERAQSHEGSRAPSAPRSRKIAAG
ncbi:MAG TPA: hypothetical protein VL996_05085 [Methylocella sp.]|nr:hypothetical protein [Methylocella sp.]